MTTLESLKRLIPLSATYGVGQLNKVLVVLLIPIYARLLTPADYGIVETARTVVVGLSIVCGFGMAGAATRIYFDQENESARRRVLGTTWILLSSVSLVLIGTLDLFGQPLAQAWFPEIPFDPYLRIALWSTLGLVAKDYVLAVFRMRERAVRYVTFQICESLVTAGLIVYFIVVLRQGALGKLKADLCVAFLVLAFSLGTLRKQLRLVFLRPVATEALKFGLPLIPHLIGGWILSLIDRILIQQFLPLSRVGVYSMGYNLGSFLLLLLVPIHTAYTPFFYSTASRGGSGPQAFGIFNRFYFALIFLVTLSNVIFAREIVQLVATAPYYEAVHVVPWVATGILFYGFYCLSCLSLFHAKKTGWLAMTTLSAGAVNIVLNLALIPRFGMMGAAYATTLSYLVFALMAGLVGQRVYRIPLEGKRIVTGGLVFVGAVLLVQVGLEGIWMLLWKLSVIGVAGILFIWVFKIPETVRLFNNKPVA